MTFRTDIHWNEPSSSLAVSRQFAIVVNSLWKPGSVYTWHSSKRSIKICLLGISAPSKPPTNVKVVSNTVSSISVSWGPIPEEGRNGFILGFVVFYREKGAVSWSNQDVDLAHSLDLTGLAFGKTYEVKVAGKTKMGRGPSSPLQPIIVGGSVFETSLLNYVYCMFKFVVWLFIICK